MKYDYDIITIGLGPAGMAVAIMGSEMGLKVLAIEKYKLGGECMNCGCIPSKALINIANSRNISNKFKELKLEKKTPPKVKNIFDKINKDIEYIDKKKNKNMLNKVKIIFGKAEFVDKHVIKVKNKKYSSKYIFIATGTKPSIPPIPGLSKVKFHTNETIFQIKKIPHSLMIIGGGAIGCELAQAFNKLGTKVTIAHIDNHLLANGDKEIGEILEKQFKKEGINVFNKARISEINEKKKEIITTINDKKVRTETILIAAGRRFDLKDLKLENAKIKYSKRGIKVNKYLQTNSRNIFAVGDCNGQFLLSHAAMHQGMIGLINSISPFKLNFKKYLVPWTVFTTPEVSSVGTIPEKSLITTTKYEDYGAAIAENIPEGFIKISTTKRGRILGAIVVGHNSGELINELGLAIQNKIPIWKIMFLQHSFPSMSFLVKRVSEEWMMTKIKKFRKIIRLIFKLKF